MASSRGTTAYGAIMLALTLVIMATIVGLLGAGDAVDAPADP